MPATPEFDAAKFDAPALRRSLLAWYNSQGRDLPWRRSRDPYAIWVSEIMLQQTQVKTVLPYYDRWLTTLPTIAALAESDQQAVLKLWQGLGYYARARNLHKAAIVLHQNFDSQFPTTFAETLALPGIGRSTAGGILSAAFNAPIAILDGNVKRVLVRLLALQRPPAKALNDLWSLSETLIDPINPRDFNQAFMDLGATVCTPKQPSCDRCPWRSACRAYNQGIQSELPMREESAPIPHKQIGVAVIWNDRGEVLIDRRKAEGLLGGMWEFPGGKIEPGETVQDCIKREIQEELAIDIAVGEHLISVDHAYSHFKVSLQVHHCQYLGGEPQPIECDEIRWVTLDQLDQFPFPKANSVIIEALQAQSPPVASIE
jgi:A/G-specific adenine glycosylase